MDLKPKEHFWPAPAICNQFRLDTIVTIGIVVVLVLFDDLTIVIVFDRWPQHKLQVVQTEHFRNEKLHRPQDLNLSNCNWGIGKSSPHNCNKNQTKHKIKHSCTTSAIAISASALGGESSQVHIIVKKNEAEKKTFGIKQSSTIALPLLLGYE